jgi:hypothetical protein
MVAMEVTDEDVVDPAVADVVPHHLNLGGLAAIDQKQILVAVYQLGGVVPSKCKRG